MESPLLVLGGGVNVRDFAGYHYPQIYVLTIILQGKESSHCIMQQAVTGEMTSKRTGLILIIREHWPPRIKIVSQYLVTSV